MSGFGFSANDVDYSNMGSQDGKFDPLPDGEYTVIVARLEPSPTKRGGVMWKVGYQVVDGRYKNRYIWENLNVECPGSAKAENIARAKILDICWALGYEDATEPSNLLNKPFTGVVKSKRDDYQSDKQGEDVFENTLRVKNSRPRNAKAAAPQPDAPAPTPEPVAQVASTFGGTVVESVPEDDLPF